jgi:methionyl-tRNA formyltransferase
MRIIFFGTPAVALPVLETLLAHGPSGWEVVGVVTQPDRPAGRSGRPHPPPVKTFALAHGLSVLQPETMRDESAVHALSELEPDVGVLFSYAQMLPRAVLRVPRTGIVNVHPSLLPKYRGPSPIQSAMLAGETETGTSLIKLVPRLDAGPIIAQERVAIPARATAVDLSDALALVGARLVGRYLGAWVAGEIATVPQEEAAASSTRLLSRQDGHIDWSKSSESLDLQVRALQPWPGAFTTLKGKNLQIMAAHALATEHQARPGAVLRWNAIGTGAIAVAAGQGVLIVESVRLEGGKAMEASAFARGHPMAPGEVLGVPVDEDANA